MIFNLSPEEMGTRWGGEVEISWAMVREGRTLVNHPIAALIHSFSDKWLDEEGGSVDSPAMWFGRSGRWLIWRSSDGFVYHQKFANGILASRVFAARQLWHDRWDEDGGEDTPLYLASLSAYGSYFFYSFAVARVGEVPHSFEVWRTLGGPHYYSF